MAKINGIKTLFKKYYTLEEIEIEHEGKTFTRERLNKQSAVAALVRNTKTLNFYFVEQFRPGPMTNLVEIVAGTLNDGEDPIECTKREVEEEIGFKVDEIYYLCEEYYMSPGYTNEKMTLFYCEVSEKISAGGGLADENENISIIEMTYDEVLENYENNYFKDGKTLLALSLSDLF